MPGPRQRRTETGPTVPRDELHAALAARRELGEELEPEVIASFLERVDDEIAARVDAHLEKRSPSHQEPWRHADWGAVVLAICSLGVAVPIVESANLVGEIAAWTAIVLVNIAYNRRHRV